jgi:hypothetical protein
MEGAPQKMFRHCWFVVLSGIALLSLAACAAPARSTERPAFRYTPLKGDPRIVFTTSNEMVLIDITSPSGIGSAAIEMISGQWPPKVVMRLHVTGLESFKFKYGAKTVEVSVAGPQTREVLVQAGQIGTVSPGDPYWLNVTYNSGYFDIEAPADFLKSGENKFTIEWIDFYR